jgi:uncharacterized protein with PQ loop repeat
MSIATLLPFLGIITSNLISFTLLPTLLQAWTTKSIYPKAPTPILFLFPPQLFFLLFAYITNDLHIVLANTLPCLIGASAIFILFRCDDVDSKVGAQVITAAVLLAIVEAYIAVVLQWKLSYNLVGKFSTH